MIYINVNEYYHLGIALLIVFNTFADGHNKMRYNLSLANVTQQELTILRKK